MTSEVIVEVGADDVGRIDKILASLLPELSRGRIQALMAEGRVSRDDVVLTDASARAQPGEHRIEIPPPTAAAPQPEDIPLTVLYEGKSVV